ncbi:hypothetical protein CLF_109331, partial [Clonorchis sinensis]
LGQPGIIPALVLPSDGMAARHRKDATAERLFHFTVSTPPVRTSLKPLTSYARNGVPCLDGLVSVSVRELPKLHRESGYADMMNYPAVDGTANPDFITVLPSGEHEVSHSSQSVYEADPRIDLMYQSSHSLPSLPNMRIMNAYDPQGANFIDCRGPICNEQYGYAAHVVSSAIPNSMEERYPIAQSIAEANGQTSLLAPPMAEPYGFSQNLTEVQFPLEVMEYPQIQLHRESGYADMMNYPAVDGTANPDFITVLPSGEHEVSHSSQSVYEADPRIDLMYQSSHSLPSLPNMRIMNAYDPQGANFIDCRGPICNEQYGYAAHVVSSAIPNSMEERYPIAQSIAEANGQTSLLAPPMAEPYGFSQNLTEVQFPLEVMEYPQIQKVNEKRPVKRVFYSMSYTFFHLLNWMDLHTGYFLLFIVIVSKTSAFKTDASQWYNRNLFENYILKKEQGDFGVTRQEGTMHFDPRFGPNHPTLEASDPNMYIEGRIDAIAGLSAICGTDASQHASEQLLQTHLGELGNPGLLDRSTAPEHISKVGEDNCSGADEEEVQTATQALLHAANEYPTESLAMAAQLELVGSADISLNASGVLQNPMKQSNANVYHSPSGSDNFGTLGDSFPDLSSYQPVENRTLDIAAFKTVISASVICAYEQLVYMLNRKVIIRNCRTMSPWQLAYKRFVTILGDIISAQLNSHLINK